VLQNKIPDAGPWGDNLELTRYDLDLNSESIVFDVGGYVGEWADKVSKKYNCKVFCFEPVKQFYDKIKEIKNDNIILQEKALGTFSGKEKMMLSGDGSSIEKYGKRKNPSHKGFDEKYKCSGSEEINVIDVNEVIFEFEMIDVMKINTEGSEYELLNNLIESGSIEKIKYLQVQFHSFVDGANEMYEDIKDKMNKTHELVLDSRWKWTYWKLKNGDVS
jgi:FkbM family methyltransferase|tara:strand:+ start:511 stop:1164 length:654 start_codon:yes stop_codon:yes gene_type:complete